MLHYIIYPGNSSKILTICKAFLQKTKNTLNSCITFYFMWFQQFFYQFLLNLFYSCLILLSMNNCIFKSINYYHIFFSPIFDYSQIESISFFKKANYLYFINKFIFLLIFLHQFYIHLFASEHRVKVINYFKRKEYNDEIWQFLSSFFFVGFYQ